MFFLEAFGIGRMGNKIKDKTLEMLIYFTCTFFFFTWSLFDLQDFSCKVGQDPPLLNKEWWSADRPKIPCPRVRVAGPFSFSSFCQSHERWGWGGVQEAERSCAWCGVDEAFLLFGLCCSLYFLSNYFVQSNTSLLFAIM